MSEHHAAAPPSKTASKTTIQLGLLTIPVRIFAGEEKASTVSRSQFTAAGQPVGSQPYNKATGEAVDKAAIVFKATASDGTTLVELTDAEKAAATGEAALVSDIIAFIPLDAIGTLYHVRQTDQIRAGQLEVKGKKVNNPAAIKGLAALFILLTARGCAALIKVGTTYGAVCPDGRYCKLAFAEDVREELPIDEADVSEAELVVFNQVADAFVGPASTPVLVNEEAAAVQAFVDAKAAGQAPAPVVAEAPAAPTGDLMAALEASLAAANAKAAA